MTSGMAASPVCVLLDLDEDALPGALLGRLDHRVVHAVGDVGQAFGPARVGEDLRPLLDVGQAVVEEREHRGGDLLAQAVAGAQILVDPDLHRWFLCLFWPGGPAERNDRDTPCQFPRYSPGKPNDGPSGTSRVRDHRRCMFAGERRWSW